MKFIMTAVLSVLLVLPAAAQDISKQTEEKKRLEAEIASIDRQLDANKNKRKESLNTLILTRRKLETRTRLIEELDRNILNYDRDIISKDRYIGRLNDRLDTLREYHARLVLGAYKTRDSKTWALYILTSKDINQGLRRWAYMKNISSSVRQQADRIRETEARITIEKDNISKLRAAAADTRTQREKEKAILTSEERKANSMVIQLSRKEKAMKQELEQMRKKVERLNREIERILAEAVKEQKSSKGSKTVDYALSAKFGENKGKLPWPIKNGIVIQKFGQTYHPVFKNLKMPYNNGINISAVAGTAVSCVFDGIVKQILVIPGYDQCVLVQHGEYFTFYCKLKQVSVKTGDKVSTGSQIGIPNTNEEGNAELHFQLWKGTQKQNPESWLR